MASRRALLPPPRPLTLPLRACVRTTRLVTARVAGRTEAEFLQRQELWASSIEERIKDQLHDVKDWQEKRREIDVKMEELRRRENDVRRRENRLIKCDPGRLLAAPSRIDGTVCGR